MLFNYRLRAGPRPALCSHGTDTDSGYGTRRPWRGGSGLGSGSRDSPRLGSGAGAPPGKPPPCSHTRARGHSRGLVLWAGTLCSRVRQPWTHSRFQHWAQSQLCDRDPGRHLDLCGSCDSPGLQLLKQLNFGRVLAFGGQCPVSAWGVVEPAVSGSLRSRQRR